MLSPTLFEGRYTGKPSVSFVIPVFNQEDRISNVLQGIFQNATTPFELVVIDDASEDSSVKVMIERLTEFSRSSPIMKEARLWQFAEPQYETACDDFGIRDAKTPWIIEIQADMTLTEFGFDRKLLSAISRYPDLLMISGRGVEPLSDLTYMSSGGSVIAPQLRGRKLMGHMFHRSSTLFRWIKGIGPSSSSVSSPSFVSSVRAEKEVQQFQREGRAGRLGRKVELDLTPRELNDTRIWVGQSVMRGPLVISRAKYLELGGFDCNRFFLGFDDADLAVRAWLSRQFKVGYVPVGFSAPLSHGSSRRRRSESTRASLAMQVERISVSWTSSTLYEVLNAPDRFVLPHPEVRDFSW